MAFESVLGRLHAVLGLEPDQIELILDIVDHDGLVVTAVAAALLGGRVGTLQLEVLILLLEVLLAVALPEEAVLLDVEGVGEEFVSGDDVLERSVEVSVARVQRGVGRPTV